MIQFCIFLLILLQYSEIFCGGKQSKFISSQYNFSSKPTPSYKKKLQLTDDSPIDLTTQDTLITINPITTHLTSYMIINTSNASGIKTQWTIGESTSIANPTEDEILEQCGRAMNDAYEMATKKKRCPTQITIMIQVDYNPHHDSK